MDRQNSTLDWYRENTEAFIARTADVDMTAHYRAFLDKVVPGGQILDLGCGAGKASLYFTQQGYRVLAVDGCRELCDYTRGRVGCPVRCMRFEELDYEDAFDGIWACASLLHVRMAELPGVLRLVRRALKKDGVFYASFKYGETEREHNGRFFSDFTEDSLRALLDEAGGFRVLCLWSTFDARPDRADERWVNVLCGRETAGACVRPVRPEDAAFLNMLMNDPSVLQALNEVPTALQDWSDAIGEWAADEDEEDDIVCDGSTPVGWLGINGLLGKDRTAYLKMAAFLPAYQDRGFGTCAIRELLDSLKRRGIEKVILYTDRDNLRAQACYRKCGFRVVESLTETMSNGKDVPRVRMETCTGSQAEQG